MNLLSRQNATEGQREDHEDEIISIVRTALVDDEARVRMAAAQAFDILQEQLGAKAIDQTIPTLLQALRQPGKGSGTALQALKEVMSVCFRDDWLNSELLIVFVIGSSYDSVPRFDTNSDGNSDVCIQCEGPCVSGYCSWQCAESEINSDTEFTGQSLGGRHR